MFKKLRTAEDQKINHSGRSHIGETMQLEGDLRTSGSIDVAGLVNGNIFAKNGYADIDSITVDSLTVNNDVHISGNLNVAGTHTSMASTDITIKDPVLTLGGSITTAPKQVNWNLTFVGGKFVINSVSQRVMTFVRTDTGYKVVNDEGYVAINTEKGNEVLAGHEILDDISNGRFRSVPDNFDSGLNIISCPSCSRVENEAFIELAQDVKKLAEYASEEDITIAVMGCRVNGPGETDDADIGLWCGPTGVNLKTGSDLVGHFAYDSILPEVDSLLARTVEAKKH